MIKTPSLTQERIRKYLNEEGRRFDGRKLEEFREIIVETGVSENAEGSARVKFGKTEVIVGVKLNVSEPYPDSPNKGNLITTAELLPLSSPRYEPGPPKFEAIELGRIIDRGIRESNFIDFEKLCIKEGEKVWTVFIDIYSINDDGNLLDAAGLGAIIALKNAKIPKYDEKEEKVLFGELTNVPIPLDKETLLPITVRKVGEKFILDPDREEEDTSSTRVTIGIQNERISSMQKGEAGTLSIEEMAKIISLSKKTYKELMKKVEKFLK